MSKMISVEFSPVGPLVFTMTMPADEIPSLNDAIEFILMIPSVKFPRMGNP